MIMTLNYQDLKINVTSGMWLGSLFMALQKQCIVLHAFGPPYLSISNLFQTKKPDHQDYYNCL